MNNFKIFNEANETKLIQNAMKMIEEQTSSCVKFSERNNESYCIDIISGEGCYSSRIGVDIGKSELSLNRSGCLTEHTVIHELVHALGFKLVVFFTIF